VSNTSSLHLFTNK